MWRGPGRVADRRVAGYREKETLLKPKIPQVQPKEPFKYDYFL